VDAGRAKKDNGVLDVLRPEPPEWLEILRQDSQRARFFAFEKFGVEIRERLHYAIIEGQ
jgi:hypothetical protein